MSNQPQIPGYRIVERVGSGGMAIVYHAIQESLDRPVALKVMSAALAAEESFTRRFLQEARTIAKLTHPNIVPIYEVGVTEQHNHFFAMQLLPGGDLTQQLAEGMSELQIAKAILGIAEALSFAHRRGFVHRDVKPGNILFSDSGNAMLTDFGIAKAVSASTRLTGTGVSVGTSHYLSPEQARGEDSDARSDIYSLGSVAFEALTGQPPYDGPDGFAIAYRHVYDPVPALPETFSHWQPLINKALAKKVSDRFQDAGEFVDALIDAVPELSTRVSGEAPVVQHRRRQRDDRTRATPVWQRLALRGPLARFGLAGSVTTLLVCLLLFGGGWWWFNSPTESERTPANATPAPTNPTAATTTAIAAGDDGNEPATVPEYEAANLAWRDAYETLKSSDADGAPVDPVQTLLAFAADALAANRLTMPSDDNALDRYARVLELEPDNADAKAGLLAIVDQYDALAMEAIENGEYQRVSTFFDRARQVARTDASLQARVDDIAVRSDSVVADYLDQAQQQLAALDTAGAVSWLERARDLGPVDPELQRQLTNLQSRAATTQTFSDPIADGGNGPDMVVVPSGSLTLTGLTVEIAPFAVSQREISRAEFEAFIGDGGKASNRCYRRETNDRGWRSNWADPGYAQGSSHPVVCIDWETAQRYTEWLSERSGERYTLLSEVQWLYLARQGGETLPTASCEAANIGDQRYAITHELVTAHGCNDGWLYTAPSGDFTTNSLGLHGLYGNVREWLADCWDESGPTPGPRGGPYAGGDCDRRVAAGHAFLSGMDDALRTGLPRNRSYDSIGFRVARTVETTD